VLSVFDDVAVRSNVPALVSVNVFLFVEFLARVQETCKHPDNADRAYAVEAYRHQRDTLLLSSEVEFSLVRFSMRFRCSGRPHLRSCLRIQGSSESFLPLSTLQLRAESFNASMLFLVGKVS